MWILNLYTLKYYYRLLLYLPNLSWPKQSLPSPCQKAAKPHQRCSELTHVHRQKNKRRVRQN